MSETSKSSYCDLPSAQPVKMTNAQIDYVNEPNNENLAKFVDVHTSTYYCLCKNECD